jgi:hypothetical protein
VVSLLITNDLTKFIHHSGKIRKVVVDLAGEKFHDPEAEAKVAMKRQ